MDDKTMTSGFASAHAFTARWEGGLSEHPDDPGGVTKYGVSLRFLRDQARGQRDESGTMAEPARKRESRHGVGAAAKSVTFDPDVDADGDVDADDVRSLTPGQAAQVLRRAFWDALALDDVPPACALALYDCAVNMGPGRACRLMQKALGVAVDGLWGPKTWAALRACPDAETALALCALRRRWYGELVRRSPEYRVFLRGWLNRVKALEVEIRRRFLA